jgi:tRNA threonylcarbamoyladenosine biosynthesis protein TsaB
MIVLLDTSTPVCKLTFVEGESRQTVEWQADRELAKGLLKYIDDQLGARNCAWADIKGIGIFKGPGSFTGLRIGMTVMNTVADSESIPIVSATGGDWQEQAIAALRDGRDEKLALPFYGREAHITKPRK